jgi:bacterial/archaeal transporter family-2 protein
MDRGAAVVLTAAAGGLIALQAPINSTLGRSVGTFQAAFLSFAIGTVALTIIAVLAKGGLAQIGEARGLAWYYLIGGLLGAVYVTCALIAVKSVGAGGVAAATITGQLTASVVLDRMGAFGLEESPLTLPRIVGVVLLLGGTYLLVR